MRTWLARPREEANLLNPAFCCMTLTSAMWGFRDVKEEGMPFVQTFMVLPMVLHKPTRESLPANIRTSMAAWLLDNASARVLFYERLLSLKPYTKEAIHFGISANWINSIADGRFITTLKKGNVDRMIGSLNNEARECVLRARFLGKWFAAAGPTHTVMTLWGIRP